MTKSDAEKSGAIEEENAGETTKRLAGEHAASCVEPGQQLCVSQTAAQAVCMLCRFSSAAADSGTINYAFQEVDQDQELCSASGKALLLDGQAYSCVFEPLF